jgi:membrane protease YdiL (CAAX protease family)
VRVLERRPVVELVSKGAWRKRWQGSRLGFALFAIVIGILAALGVYSVGGVNAASVVLAPLAAALMAGITEEVLVRGIAFRILEGWLGSWLALAISASLFGLMHLPNPQATWLSSAAIALEAGVMLAAAYMVTRRLWLAIGIHAAWNFAQSGIFGVAASGVESTGYLKGDLQGPALLSGGAFGPEASIVAVVVCLATGAVMLLVAHRKGHVLRPSWRVAARALPVAA